MKEKYKKNIESFSFSYERLGLYLSRIFLAGIIASLFFIAVGLIIIIIFKLPYGEYILKNDSFYFADVLKGLLQFSAISYFYFAIFFLVLTPVACILFCIFYFLKKKQYRFMSVATGVLIVLALSVIAGILIK